MSSVISHISIRPFLTEYTYICAAFREIADLYFITKRMRKKNSSGVRVKVKPTYSPGNCSTSCWLSVTNGLSIRLFLIIRTKNGQSELFKPIGSMRKIAPLRLNCKPYFYRLVHLAEFKRP